MRPPRQSDISAQVQRVLIDGWRRMSSPQKAKLMDAWSTDVRTLALAGVRQRFPDATATEQLVELGRTLYGDEVISQEVVESVYRHHHPAE